MVHGIIYHIAHHVIIIMVCCDKGLFTLAHCRSLPSACCFFSSIAHFFSILQFHAQEWNLFHPLVITRIGNSLKVLNKFRIAIFRKLHVYLCKSVNVRNDWENAQKVQHLSGLLGSFFKQAVDTW